MFISMLKIKIFVKLSKPDFCFGYTTKDFFQNCVQELTFCPKLVHTFQRKKNWKSWKANYFQICAHKLTFFQKLQRLNESRAKHQSWLSPALYFRCVLSFITDDVVSLRRSKTLIYIRSSGLCNAHRINIAQPWFVFYWQKFPSNLGCLWTVLLHVIFC